MKKIIARVMVVGLGFILTANFVSADFAVGDLNVGVLKTRLKAEGAVDKLILRKLGVKSSQLEKVSEEQLIMAMNEMLLDYNLYSKINEHELVLSAEIMKLLKDIKSLADRRARPKRENIIKLNSGLLKAIYSDGFVAGGSATEIVNIEGVKEVTQSTQPNAGDSSADNSVSLRPVIIYLKSGKMQKGKIIDETVEKIILKTEQENLEIEKSNIDRIVEGVLVKLHSGRVMRGIITKENSNYILLETNNGSFRIERKDVLEIAEDENGTANISPLPYRPVKGVNDGVKRYSIGGQLGLPLAFNAEGEKDLAFGLDLNSFEFISVNGWGMQFSPTALYVYQSSKKETRSYRYYTTYDTTEISSIYYLPVIVKYSFQNQDPMPYLGFGLAYHLYWHSFSYRMEEEERGAHLQFGV